MCLHVFTYFFLYQQCVRVVKLNENKSILCAEDFFVFCHIIKYCLIPHPSTGCLNWTLTWPSHLSIRPVLACCHTWLICVFASWFNGLSLSYACKHATDSEPEQLQLQLYLTSPHALFPLTYDPVPKSTVTVLTFISDKYKRAVLS